MSMETGATKTGATSTKESQASRERDKMGQVQIVVVDLRKTQPTDQVNALRKGEGSLFMNVERIIEQLVTAGTIGRTRSRLSLWCAKFRSCHRGVGRYR